MTSTYAVDFAMPEGFPQILKDFTREILRAQPEDINAFGAQYFGDMLAAQNADAGMPDIDREELRAKIEQLFMEADADGNGYLDHREFKAIFHSLKSELGLTNRDLRFLMAEADENDDGVIEYAEFVPIAVDLVESMYARILASQREEARQDDAMENAEAHLLHGMPREELAGILEQIFKDADSDGNGWLSRSEFQRCLRNAELGLTRKEINVLMAEVDEDEDSKITYEEFAPLCFDILVQIVSQEFANNNVPTEEQEIGNFFSDLFASADTEGAGVLYYEDLMDLIQQADLGLTTIQIHAVMAEAEEDEEGLVDYNKFSSKAAAIVSSMIDIRIQGERYEQMKANRALDDWETVFGMDQAGLEGALSEAFTVADETGAGTLSRSACKAAIASALPGVNDQQVRSLMSYAGRGDVDYNALVEVAFNCFMQLKDYY